VRERGARGVHRRVAGGQEPGHVGRDEEVRERPCALRVARGAMQRAGAVQVDDVVVAEHCTETRRAAERVRDESHACS
jgi:hypothetical protein